MRNRRCAKVALASTKRPALYLAPHMHMHMQRYTTKAAHLTEVDEFAWSDSLGATATTSARS